MKIMAGTRHYPTLQEYLNTGNFDLNQRGIIASLFNYGLSPKKISIIANPEFDARQMLELRDGFLTYKLSISDVLLYANPALNYRQMEFIKHCISSKTLSTVEFYKLIDPKYSLSEMRAIYAALISGISSEDVEAFEDIISQFPELDDGQSTVILDGFLNGLSLDQIKLYATPMFNCNQMYQILGGLVEDEFTYDQVKLYADSRYSYQLMQAIRNAMHSGATIEELSEIVQPGRAEVLIYGDIVDRWGDIL